MPSQLLRPFQPSGQELKDLNDRLCTSCVPLIVWLCQEWPKEDSSIWRRRRGLFGGHTKFAALVHLDNTVSTLLSSAQNCPLCALIYENLRPESEGDLYYDIKIFLTTPHEFWVWCRSTPTGSRWTATSGQVHFGLYQGKAHEDTEGCSKVFWAWNDQTATERLQAVPPEYPCTDEALEILRQLMKNCEKNHEICRHTRVSSQLPKRVIDVSACPDRISLHESQGEAGPYVALSYCWGSALPLKTTTKTIDAHREGISMNEIPATIRDAILISKSLGFKYLWIDALCIIQDDPGDWVDQSRQMANIYRGCALNICAADAVDCGSGMLPTVHDTLLHVSNLEPKEDGGAEAVFIAPCRDREFILDMDNCKLNSRGWVFQEGLVSVASLYVTHRDGLAWRCCTTDGTLSALMLNSTSADGVKTSLTLKRSWADTFRKMDSGASSISNDTREDRKVEYEGGSEERLLFGTWYDWINTFTEKQLTKESDRLPAVAGLAALIAQESRMTYIAGLWKEDLVVGLSWMSPDGSTKLRSKTLPSWSWGSYTGSIEYSFFFSMHMRHRGKLEVSESYDLQILDVKVQEEFPGSYGAVRQASIEAIGTVQKGRNFRVNTWLRECNFDDSQAMTSGDDKTESLYFLRLTSVSRYKPHEENGPYIFFLMLEKADERENVFRRVGCGFVNGSSKYYHSDGAIRPSPDEDIFASSKRLRLSLV